MLNDQTNLEFQAAVGDLKREIYQLGVTLSLPHVLMRPKISIDGNQWCALYGDNLQDGVAGFGDSPCEAMGDFDRAWNTRLKPNVYESKSHQTPYRQECADLAEAIGCAWADMETGEAWPGRILRGDAVLWEQCGPLRTRDSLTAFAKANGVTLDGA